MARISNYDNDATVSGTDKVLGTDSSTTFTKNFRVIDLAEFFFSSLSGDISVNSSGAVSVSSVGTLGSNSGNYVSTLTARNGITSSGATSGATISHILDVDSTQTHITSILNAGLCIGRDSDNKICFTTDNEIRLTVNGVLDLILSENALTPGSSDGTALGTASLMWSDLFLASGAIINFNNGNLTLTHSSNALTLSGSDKLQFGDDATYIHQSADSVLDLVSDGELELNATTEVEINTALVDVNASGAVTIDAGGNSNITVTGSLDVDASAALTIDSATSISIGTSADKPIDIDSTTLDIDASDAVTIDGTSISIDGTLSSNLTVTGSGQSLTLEATGGGTQQVVINSAGTSTSAVDINATAGGIDIDASGALAIDSATSISIGTNADKPVAIDSTTFALDAASTVVVDGTGISIDGILDSNFTVDGSGQSLNLTVSGGGTQVLSLDSAGTGTNAIDINATGGGVDIVAAANVSMLAATAFVAQGNTSAKFGDDTEQIEYDGSGNLDIDAVAIDLDSSDAINILAAGNASDITIKTEHVAGSAFHLDANSNVGSIVDIDAGILNISSDGLTSILSASTFDIDAVGAVTIDGSAITIGADDSGVDISIGHTTSETTVNDNLNVKGTLKINVGTDPSHVITFPTARGSNNQVLKTNGSGVLSFTDPSSGVTVADSTANTDFPIVFHDESNNLLDDTNAFEYNPSTGLLTVNKLTPKTNAAGDIGTSTVAYNDLFLSNGGVIEFIAGTGEASSITHIDSGSDGVQGSLRISSSTKLEFNDSAVYIASLADGHLDLVSDTEVQIVSPIVNIDASTRVDVSNLLQVGGNLTFTNDGNHDIVINSTAAGTPGKYLAISAGSAAASGNNNTAGGDLFLQSGNGDGNGTSDIIFKTKTATGGNSAIERMRIKNAGVDINAAADISGNLVLGAGLSVGGHNVTDIDDSTSLGNSNVKLATQKAIKAYVDAQISAEDLDVTSDSGTIDIDLDSETLAISGGNAISTSASGTTVTVNHADTSSQASVDNSGSTFIQDLTFDTYGHVTGATSAAVPTLNQDTTGTAAKVTITDLTNSAYHPIVFHNDSNQLFDDTDNFQFKQTNSTISGTTDNQYTLTLGETTNYAHYLHGGNIDFKSGATISTHDAGFYIMGNAYFKLVSGSGGFVKKIAAPSEVLTLRDQKLSLSVHTSNGNTSDKMTLTEVFSVTAAGNLTVTGELDGATLDISGDADINGNLTGVNAFTASGKIQGGEIEGTSLDINGAADISGSVRITSTTDATSTTTGALKVAGGVGIEKRLFVEEDLFIGNAPGSDGTTARSIFSKYSGSNFIEVVNSSSSNGGRMILGPTSSGFNGIYSRNHNASAGREFRIIQLSATVITVAVDGDTTFVGDVITGSGKSFRGGNFIINSDRRLKSEIEPIKEGLEIIKQFTSYNYIKGGEKESGFIAQEVREAIPHTVYENNEGMLSMSDRGVVAHMHKAILELEKRLISIEEKLK